MEIPPIARKSSNTGTTFFDILNNEDPEEILEKEHEKTSQTLDNSIDKPKIRCLKRYRLFLVCAAWFIVSSILGGQLFYYSLRLDQDHLQEKLAVNCRQSTSLLKNTLSRLIGNLSNHVYFVTSVGQGMSYEMFTTFSKFSTQDSLKYSLAWQPQVKHSERIKWEQENALNITVAQHTSHNLTTVPSHNRTFYYPIRYGIRYEQQHLGIDVLQTARSDTILKALGTLKTAVSPLREFDLMDTDGIRIYLPVLVDQTITHKGDYNQFKNNETKIHENVLGLMSLTIKIESLLENITNISDGNYVRIIDKTDNNYIIYSNNGRDEVPENIMRCEKNLPFGDREWQINCYSPKIAFFPSKTKSSLFFAIILCIIFSTIILFILTKKYLSAKELISIGNKRLENSNALVTDMATNSKAILMTITDPLLLFDRDGKITGANTYALTKTGYTSEDISKSADLFIGNVINIDQEPNNVSRLVIEPGMREVTITCKDGTQFYAEANFSSQTVIGSNFAQVVTFRDISAKKKAAIDLWNAKTQAEKADKSKGDILLYLCHEIRNPVHAISGYAKLLMDQKHEDDPSSDEMENILCSSKFLSELVNEVLDLANLHDNDLVLNEKDISLSELHTSTGYLTSSVEGSKYQLTSRLLGPGSMRVVCDPSAIQLVVHRLGCLLSDSADTGQHEEAVLMLEIELVEDDSEYAIVKYSIHCPNKVIPSHYLAEDFDPLVQGNGSMGDQFGMKGISLTLTRIMVQKMGGRLISTSNLNIGAHFSFVLKFRKALDQHFTPKGSSSSDKASSVPGIESESNTLDPATVGIPGSNKKTRKKVKSKSAHPKQKKVLKKGDHSLVNRSGDSNEPCVEHRGKIILAEDNLICQKLAVRLLTKNGYEVTTANNGLEAVQAMESCADYDIALLDIHMPIMGGIEAGQTMRKRLGFSGQIVALTANTTSEYRQACVDAGFDAFAPKPIKEKELITILTNKNHLD